MSLDCWGGVHTEVPWGGGVGDGVGGGGIQGNRGQFRQNPQEWNNDGAKHPSSANMKHLNHQSWTRIIPAIHLEPTLSLSSAQKSNELDTGKTEHPTSDQFGNSTPEKIVCKANTYLDQQNQIEKKQILSATIIMPYIICKHTSMYTLYTQYIITHMYKIHTCLYIYICIHT